MAATLDMVAEAEMGLLWRGEACRLVRKDLGKSLILFSGAESLDLFCLVWICWYGLPTCPGDCGNGYSEW